MLHENPQMFNGYKIHIVDPVCTETKVKRSWKERLFTLPFRPFCKSKIVSAWVETVEDGQVIQNNDCIMMNAKTWAILKSQKNPFQPKFNGER